MDQESVDRIVSAQPADGVAYAAALQRADAAGAGPTLVR